MWGWRLSGLAGVMLAGLVATAAQAADDGRKLVLVTLDGLSWTEVFRGADVARAADPTFAPDKEGRETIHKAFVEPTDRATALMPFLHGTVATHGVLLGDRDHGGCAAVANDKWFSYPGYNEILTGRTDPAITSNSHGPNRNVTVLEWLNRRDDFAGRVQVVASWNAFKDIFNTPRSGLPVNDGWDNAPARTPAEAQIAALQASAPPIWPTVRLDTFTHAYALETLKRQKPTVLYVAYGETDDFAHDGRYDQTLWAARHADAYIAELWATLQADPAYAGKTTLIVTTDHGRGTSGGASWKDHGRNVPGADGTWIAMLGPGVTPGAKPAGCASSSQLAATALQALGLDWKTFDPAAGPPLELR